MALSQFYVDHDPAVGSDSSGDGLSAGTAFLTIGKAFEEVDSVTGAPGPVDHCIIWVKASPSNPEVLSAQIDFDDLTMTPSITNFLSIIGYKTTIGDGGDFSDLSGYFTIDCNSAVATPFVNEDSHCVFMNMKLVGHTSTAISSASNCIFANVDISGNAGGWAVMPGTDSKCINVTLHDSNAHTRGFSISNRTVLHGCTAYNLTSGSLAWVANSGQDTQIVGCLFYGNTALAECIDTTDDGGVIMNNRIIGPGSGSRPAIQVNSGHQEIAVIGNVVTDWTGGSVMAVASTGNVPVALRNTHFNCNAYKSGTGQVVADDGGNNENPMLDPHYLCTNPNLMSKGFPHSWGEDNPNRGIPGGAQNVTIGEQKFRHRPVTS